VTQGWGASTEAYGDDKAEPRADEEGKEAPFAPIEEEPVKTLDQYLAEKNAKKVGDAPAARKANEGADDAKWKDAKPLVKEEEAYFAGKSDAGSKKTKSKKAKAVVVIEQTFAEERRDGSRGGRGGRGGSRGARGAREGRGGRQDNGYGVNVDDASAFPELGA
jgi:plasminogen activator inhibitor 1 RNA-binding protein